MLKFHLGGGGGEVLYRIGPYSHRFKKWMAALWHGHKSQLQVQILQFIFLVQFTGPDHVCPLCLGQHQMEVPGELG